MASPNPTRSQPTLKTLLVSADLLSRVERSRVAMAPEQYRALVLQVQDLLRDTPPGDALRELLDAYPDTAALYENLNYAHAGLCRAPLEQALNAELAASAAIRKAMKG